MNPITELRKKYNYSQAQLAEMLSVSQSAVSQWELGKAFPDVITARKLALIFGVTIEDLLNSSKYAPLQNIAIIRNNCGKLNEEGLKKVLEYTEDLLVTEKYNKPQIFPGDSENGNG